MNKIREVSGGTDGGNGGGILGMAQTMTYANLFASARRNGTFVDTGSAA
jgi:hypothetical protein